MLNVIAASGREAGLEINVEKTKVLVLGDLAVAHPTETPLMEFRLNVWRTSFIWDLLF